MNQEQFDKLCEYIDAKIRESHSYDSSDGGLIESMQASRIKAELEQLLVTTP